MTLKEIDGSADSNSRAWEDLDKDVLITIYQKLDLKDLIVGAPLSCSSWYKASKDPFLWSAPNCFMCTDYFLFVRRGVPRQFSFAYPLDYKHVEVTKLIEFVVNRSQRSITSIKFPGFTNVDDLLFVAERCPGVKHFKFFMNYKKLLLGKKTVCMAISKLKELESMDVQQEFIDETTLKLIDECCPNFIKLRIRGLFSADTASLIPKSLPKLRILDISETRVGRKALLVILNGCKNLEHLDISMCRRDERYCHL